MLIAIFIENLSFAFRGFKKTETCMLLITIHNVVSVIIVITFFIILEYGTQVYG